MTMTMIRSAFYALVLTSLSAALPNCTLHCKRGLCEFGNATVSLKHPVDKHPAVPIDFLLMNNIDGMFCTCPTDFTGVSCTTKYESCADDKNICYHGGKCHEVIVRPKDSAITSRMTCDCTHAKDEDGSHAVGEFCERTKNITGHSLCPNSDSSKFCVNHGVCESEGETDKSGSICKCQTGTTGRHCEFFEPDRFPCTAHCKNGGTCQIGLRNATDEEIKMDSGADPNHGFSFCSCPKGYHGDACQFKTVDSSTCGDTICLHGSSCVTTKTTTGVTLHHCDCTKAANKSIAGTSCQHEATSFCTEKQGANGRHFCANNGTCVDHRDGTHSCKCVNGWQGDKCQFSASTALHKPQVTVCKLECLNKGHCAEGAKDHGVLNASIVSALARTHNDDFEHCVCPKGFGGFDCSDKVDVCPKETHACVNGGKCTVHNKTKDACDCSGSSTHAGTFCQHKVTQTCEQKHFCTNGGTCAPNREKKCICLSGWKGDKCQFAVNEEDVSFLSVGSSGGSSKGGIAGAVIGTLAVVGLLTAIFLFRRKRAAKEPIAADVPYDTTTDGVSSSGASSQFEEVAINKGDAEII